MWQIYPQSENAHLVKLDAFLSKQLCGFEIADPISELCKAWNGIGKIEKAWPQFIKNLRSIEEHSKLWAARLDQTGNLANNLVSFVNNQ